MTVGTAPTSATGTRAFSSSSVQGGEQIVVTITASGLGSFGGVIEMIPAGFVYVSTTHEDAPTVTGQSVSFTVFSGSANFTYTVRASSIDGVYSFSGTVTDDQRRSGAITGDATVTIGTGTPPDGNGGTGGTGGGGGGGGGGTPDNNRPPAFTEGARAARAISEDSGAGTEVGGAVTADDPNDDELVYSLAGADAGSFDIDGASGQITVASGASFDYEDKSSHAIEVIATDPGGRTDTIEITVNLINEDEDGSVSISPDAPRVQEDATAMIEDPDGEVTGATWTWESSSDGETWTAIAGANMATYAPAVSDEGMWLRATATYTDGHGAGKVASGTSAEAVTSVTNIAPEFDSGEAERSVSEDASVGSAVGDPVTASDPDSESLSYTLGGDDAGWFTIDAATGQITTAATLDYEMRSSFSVTVSVSDGMDAEGGADDMADAMVTVMISVTDVDEAVPEEPAEPADGDELPDTGGLSAPAWMLALAAAAAAGAVAGGAALARAQRSRRGAA